MPTRVAIVFNEPAVSPGDSHWIWRSGVQHQVPREQFRDASEYGVLDEVGQIDGFLAEAGYQTVRHAVEDVAGLVAFLGREQPDIVFNCCESLRGRADHEMNVAAIFELAGIPYTGSSPLTLGISLDKGVAKALFRAHGVPTPGFRIAKSVDTLPALDGLWPPLIVKPLAEDASIGIDADAVVHDLRQLMARIRFVHGEFKQPALIEEFIDGRELNVALLASSPIEFEVLPISEIRFDGLPPGTPHILGYEAKWLLESPAYRATMPECPARLDDALAGEIRAVASRAARAVGLRDYGRIDLRVRKGDNAVFVLEANPNPDITYDSGFIRAAAATGRSHARTVVEILERALERVASTGRRSP